MLIPFDLGFRGAGRPLRDPRIEAVAASSWKSTLELQGTVGYAGDDENPRELPNRTLYWMREKMQDALDAIRDDDSRIAPSGLYFAFCDARVAMPAGQVIAVPCEDLWWLAAPGDLLLLSDKVTAHYTTVLSASDKTGRMQMVDEWPERVFLREGFNEEEICARVEPFFAGVFESMLPGKKEISITRDEFLRVAVGLVTLDAPPLLERYVERSPALRDDAAAMLSFGLTLMAPSHDAIARFAAPYFVRAEHLGTAAGQTQLAREAAAWSHVAHAIASLKQRRSGDPFAVAPFFDEVVALDQRHSEKALLALLDVEVLCRLGHAAGHAAQYEAAFRWLDLAVARDPFHDAAHSMRAEVRQFRNEPAEQVADATEALARNAAWIARRYAENDARDPRDAYGRLDDLQRIAGLETRRANEFQIRAAGLFALGRLDEARADAEAAQALRPDAPGPKKQLGIIARAQAAKSA